MMEKKLQKKKHFHLTRRCLKRADDSEIKITANRSTENINIKEEKQQKLYKLMLTRESLNCS